MRQAPALRRPASPGPRAQERNRTRTQRSAPILLDDDDSVPQGRVCRSSGRRLACARPHRIGVPSSTRLRLFPSGTFTPGAAAAPSPSPAPHPPCAHRYGLRSKDLRRPLLSPPSKIMPSQSGPLSGEEGRCDGVCAGPSPEQTRLPECSTRWKPTARGLDPRNIVSGPAPCTTRTTSTPLPVLVSECSRRPRTREEETGNIFAIPGPYLRGPRAFNPTQEELPTGKGIRTLRFSGAWGRILPIFFVRYLIFDFGECKKEGIPGQFRTTFWYSLLRTQ